MVIIPRLCTMLLLAKLEQNAYSVSKLNMYIGLCRKSIEMYLNIDGHLERRYDDGISFFYYIE